ncbi:MAG: ABC transporter permease [Proteobacteria bacterium]|nr:ABC transporter permease [Pseudomonadota bacterium]
MALDLVRLGAIARKETLQLRRDSRSLILAFLLPLLLLLLFGYAISWDVHDIKMGVMDQDRSASSRELVDAFQASGYFKVRETVDRTQDIDPLLERGDVQVVLVIPADFSADIGAGRTATIQALVDGSDANTATIVLAYARAIVASYALETQLQGRDCRPRLTADSRVWYNEDLASRNTIVPGLIAVIMMIVAAMLTSLTIAREWERGTMEQLAATPVTRTEVVLGKLLPYVGIGLFDVVVCAALGVWLFDVPLRGSVLLLMVLSTTYIIGSLGLGIFISAAARSQLLATQLAMLLTFLPAFLLSGFMYAIDVMPKSLQTVTFLVPAKYFLVVTRGIFLKDVGVDVLRVQGLLMILFAVVGLALAIWVFRKELKA